MPDYLVAQLDEIEPVACPCGTARRAFAAAPSAASVHITEISANARTHYHKQLTEVYVILDGAGQLELDGEPVAVRPMTAVLIKPRCRHRAVGRMRVLITCIPAFDPADEWFD